MNTPLDFFALVGLMNDTSGRVLLRALLAVVLALIVHRVGGALIWRLTRQLPISSVVAERIWRPARLALPVLALQGIWHAAPDTFPLIAPLRHANGLLLLASLTWLAQRAAGGLAQGIIKKYPLDVEDNLQARRVHTQTRLISRTVSFMILVAGMSLMLMTFPGARQVGTSLLASAGVIGIIAGIAARPVFSNLIAGLQLALSQPLRIDDVLIIEGEWGHVEEITGTYVVLRIWDQRRLIIPLQWFIEKPFQNWTRSSSQLIGTVFLWVDYRMPLAPLREAAQHACEAASEWDGRLCQLQVVEAAADAVQLRLLVTSQNASLNWDLRCKVREALVDFMQREYPQFLPLTRAELTLSPKPGSAAETDVVQAFSPARPLPSPPARSA